ncbi:hypothetical protein [Variovorax boronicumulans]
MQGLSAFRHVGVHRQSGLPPSIPNLPDALPNPANLPPSEAGPALTPPQKRFNTLIRQIEKARQTLAAWHDGIGTYRQAHAQVLLPLEDELMAVRRQWVFALDALLGQPRGWTKTDRETLRELVCDAASELLHARDGNGDDGDDGDDEELKALFARHAEIDFEADRQQMVLAMKDVAEAMIGLDLGDDEGIDTRDDLLARCSRSCTRRKPGSESNSQLRHLPMQGLSAFRHVGAQALIDKAVFRRRFRICPMRSQTLQISPSEAGPALTPPQKRFNTPIRQIEKARQTLAAWHDGIGTYRQAHAQVLLPLEDELMAVRRQWVFALDALLGQPRGWTKTDRETLRELVCDAASELLHARDGNGDDGDDEELKALVARHAEIDFEADRQQMVLAMKDVAEAMIGLDLGDDEGIDTRDDLLARCSRSCTRRRRPKRPNSTPRPRSPCATSSASSPVPCTPAVKPMRGSATPRRR